MFTIMTHFRYIYLLYTDTLTSLCKWAPRFRGCLIYKQLSFSFFTCQWLAIKRNKRKSPRTTKESKVGVKSVPSLGKTWLTQIWRCSYTRLSSNKSFGRKINLLSWNWYTGYWVVSLWVIFVACGLRFRDMSEHLNVYIDTFFVSWLTRRCHCASA